MNDKEIIRKFKLKFRNFEMDEEMLDDFNEFM